MTTSWIASVLPCALNGVPASASSLMVPIKFPLELVTTGSKSLVPLTVTSMVARVLRLCPVSSDAYSKIQMRSMTKKNIYLHINLRI